MTGTAYSVEKLARLDLREHVEALSAHYRLSGEASAALAMLAAMASEPDEDVLPRRPPTDGLVAVRLSSCAAAVELHAVRRARRIVDIGSGLGFPGLVLASMLPRASISLVEAREQRCAFLRGAVAAMGLTNVEVVHSQAQNWAEGAMSAELVTARALARPRVMVTLSAPLLAVGGRAVIWGNPKRDPAKEADTEAAAEAVGMRPVRVHRTKPVGLGTRFLYVYEKVAETPPRHSLKAMRGSGRQDRNRARADAVHELHKRAAERLEWAARRVQELETSGAEDPENAAELERVRAIVRKVERKVEVLAERQARAKRKVRRAQEK